MEVVFAIPGDITLPTGGYAYDREVLALLPTMGIEVRHVELPGGFPDPSPDDLARTAAQIAATPSGTVLLIDGLAYGAMPAALIDGFDRPIVALVHHPLCLEAGVAPERAETLRALETAALARAARVIVTSPTTARTLVDGFRRASRSHHGCGARHRSGGARDRQRWSGWQSRAAGRRIDRAAQGL